MSAVRSNVVPLPVDPLLAEYRRVQREVLQARSEAEAFGGPCETCRHSKQNGCYDFIERHCHHPLVKSYSFDRIAGNIAENPVLVKTWKLGVKAVVPPACGDNHRLYEPHPTRWQRLIAWLLAPWKAAPAFIPDEAT